MKVLLPDAPSYASGSALYAQAIAADNSAGKILFKFLL